MQANRSIVVSDSVSTKKRFLQILIASINKEVRDDGECLSPLKSDCASLVW